MLRIPELDSIAPWACTLTKTATSCSSTTAGDDDDGMPDARPCLHGNRPDGELNVLYSVAEHVRALEAALPLA